LGAFGVLRGVSGGSEGPFLTPFRGMFSPRFTDVNTCFVFQKQVDFGCIWGPQGGPSDPLRTLFDPFSGYVFTLFLFDWQAFGGSKSGRFWTPQGSETP
jgi:hypothetical protein